MRLMTRIASVLPHRNQLLSHKQTLPGRQTTPKSPDEKQWEDEIAQHRADHKRRMHLRSDLFGFTLEAGLAIWTGLIASYVVMGIAIAATAWFSFGAVQRTRQLRQQTPDKTGQPAHHTSD